MSAPSHVQRCRQWIGEQIEAMATLRTSNSRDLSFKSWRQNTVTVLQRIWPGDRERVERFRRITFSPPQARPDGKLIREWFGKGLGESRTYLQSLLDVIDREGVPEPPAADRERDARSLEDEVGFPLLDLDRPAGDPPPAGWPAPDEPPAAPAGELDVTVGYTTPDDQGATPRDPRTPAPPSLSMRWRAPMPAAPRRRNAAPEPAADPAGDSAPPALGESALHPRAPEARPAPAIPRAPSLPAAEAVPAVAREAAEPPVPAGATPDAPAEPKSAAPPRAEAPATAGPAEPATDGPDAARQRREPATRMTGRPRNGRGKAQKKGPPRPRLKDLLGLDEFDARLPEPGAEEAPAAPAAKPAAARAELPGADPATVSARERAAAGGTAEPAASKAAVPPAPAAESPAVAESPAAESPAVAESPAAAESPVTVPPRPEPGRAGGSADDDEEDRERATQFFMLNSPVFGAVGRPVQRRTDATAFLDPDAVAVATLAAELGPLGVPEGMKASLAARLLDVAKHLEDGELEWALLRGTVTDAMQYPDLARRLLPVLLPWLERAA